MLCPYDPEGGLEVIQHVSSTGLVRDGVCLVSLRLVLDYGEI